MITYKLNLVCSRCSAEITISGNNNDKIKWRVDGRIAAAMSKARRWIVKNPKVKRIENYTVVDPIVPDDIRPFITRTTAPTFAGALLGYQGLEFHPVYHEYHYQDCPACGGRVYLGSAISPPKEVTN